MMNVFERTVNETVLSGIAPLQQNYFGVFDGYVEHPLAYRAHTTLFTTASGTVDEIRDLVNDNELGVRLSLRNLAHAIRTMQELSDKDHTIRWISVEASLSLLKNKDALALISDVLEKEHCEDASKICLEFLPYKSDDDFEQIKIGMADVKACGLMIGIAPIGQNFAISTLVDLPIDYVVLSEEMTALATDRNKPGVLAALIGLLHTMNIQVIAEGVDNDDQIRELTAVECFGFLPLPTYTGEFMLPMGSLSRDEIMIGEASL